MLNFPGTVDAQSPERYAKAYFNWNTVSFFPQVRAEQTHIFINNLWLRSIEAAAIVLLPNFSTVLADFYVEPKQNLTEVMLVTFYSDSVIAITM